MHTVYGKLSSGETFTVGMQMTIHLQLPTASRRVLRESYRITYSAKIRGKIIAIECKIVKTTKVFPLESFAVHGIVNGESFTGLNFNGFRGFSENHKSFSCESFALSINIIYIVTAKIHILWIPQNFSPVKVSLFMVYSFKLLTGTPMAESHTKVHLHYFSLYSMLIHSL